MTLKERTCRRIGGLCTISSTSVAPQNANINSAINKATCTWALSYNPLVIILPLKTFVFHVVASQSEDFSPLILLCLGNLVTVWTVTAPGLPTLLHLAGNWALQSCQSIHTCEHVWLPKPLRPSVVWPWDFILLWTLLPNFFPELSFLTACFIFCFQLHTPWKPAAVKISLAIFRGEKWSTEWLSNLLRSHN